MKNPTRQRDATGKFLVDPAIIEARTRAVLIRRYEQIGHEVARVCLLQGLRRELCMHSGIAWPRPFNVADFCKVHHLSTRTLALCSLFFEQPHNPYHRT